MMNVMHIAIPEAELNALRDENATLTNLCDEQLRILASVASQYAELVAKNGEASVAFLREKVALLERAEAAEAENESLYQYIQGLEQQQLKEKSQ